MGAAGTVAGFALNLQTLGRALAIQEPTGFQPAGHEAALAVEGDPPRGTQEFGVYASMALGGPLLHQPGMTWTTGFRPEHLGLLRLHRRHAVQHTLGIQITLELNPGPPGALLPVYGDPADTQAIQAMSAVAGDRSVVPINCRTPIEEFGSLHCLTMQLPKGAINDA